MTYCSYGASDPPSSTTIEHPDPQHARDRPRSGLSWRSASGIRCRCTSPASAARPSRWWSAWRRNRRPPAAFLVDERDRSFRTPVYANGLLMGPPCAQMMVFFLAVTRETWVGLLGAGLFAVLLAGQWRALRYGHGLTLRARGIEAAKSAGTLVIPWEALGSQPPGRGENWWEIKLSYARPDLVTATGWVPERAVMVFEAADPDLSPRRWPYRSGGPACVSSFSRSPGGGPPGELARRRRPP